MNKNKEIRDATAATGQNEPAAIAAAAGDEASRQLDDYKESLQRLQAEFENYKKRVDKEKAQFRQFAAAEVVKSFLPVLDSFELALKSIIGSNGKESEKTAIAAANPALAGLHSRQLPTCADEKVVKGLELIYGQFYSALESQGLRPIKALGERLDPYKHEVLMQEETADERKDGIVAEEFQKGYMLNDVVLRYSKVKVLKFVKNKNVSGGN